MNIIKNKEDWEVVKYKLIRKFNNLEPSELVFNQSEDKLISYLEKKLCKTRNYVEFMLKKMVYYKTSNRL